MYTFSHSATEQTPALTDYRYIGGSPYNYVTFNNELWRIIGIFTVEDENGNSEQRLKIILDEKLSNDMVWSSASSNNWSVSNIVNYLNNTYYSTLSSGALQMVQSAKYYTAGIDAYPNGETYYSYERGNARYNTTRPLYWVGTLGVIYPSDYIFTFALGIDNICYSTPNSCQNYSLSWLNPIVHHSWTITMRSTSGRGAFCFNSKTVTLVTVDKTYAVEPTLYLKANVKIVGGDGSQNNPYQISL